MNTQETNHPANAAPQTPVEEDLDRILDERHARRQKSNRRMNLILLLLLAAGMAGAGIWYQTHPALQAQVNQLIQNLKEGRKDFALVADPTEMKKTFDKSLAEISTRKDEIGSASSSLGVDSSKVTEDGMDDEMRGMMGGEGRTIGDSNKQLREKAKGIVGAPAQQPQKTTPTATKEKTPAPQPTAMSKPAPSPVHHQEGISLD